VSPERHVLFVTAPHGYELVEREGDAPAVGAEVELEGESRRLVVTKVGPSPLPGDERRCAYVQTAR
jgi:hypothetical protein